MPKTDAERQKKLRENKKKDGFIWVGFWIKKEWKPIINKWIKKKTNRTT